MVVSHNLLHPLFGDPWLAVDAWAVLGGPGAFGTFGDGVSPCWAHALVGAPGVQNSTAWS